MFTNMSLLEPDATMTLICQSQHHDHALMKQWQEEYHTNHVHDPNGGFTYRCDAGEAVVPPDLELK